MYLTILEWKVLNQKYRNTKIVHCVHFNVVLKSGCINVIMGLYVAEKY
jgi:hypothetical protein